jgi:hypothetical protein
VGVDVDINSYKTLRSTWRNVREGSSDVHGFCVWNCCKVEEGYLFATLDYSILQG